jgi:cbb3-type cytochrome oxidase subunit 3
MEQIVYGVVLLIAFGGVVAWVFAKKRKAQFDRDARIPTRDKGG